MKWTFFSRKPRDARPVWRLVAKPDADVFDVQACPSAAVESAIASKYLLASRKHEATLFVLGMAKRGVLAGPDVSVVDDEAARRGVDVARIPRAGRGAARPAQTVSLDEMMLSAGDDCAQEKAGEDELACLIYTSGTEGRPKGAMLSHRNFLSDCRLIGGLCRIAEGDTVAGVLPMFHIFGLTNVLIGAFVNRAAIVLVPQYSPASLLKAVAESGASFLLATPTIFRHVLRIQQKRCIVPKGALKVCISGAAPLEKEIISEFEEAFGSKLCEGYGLTESTSAVCLNPPDGTRKHGSIGMPPPGIEMKIAGDDGVDLPAGAVGEILVKGEVVMLGYYNMPGETAGAISGGWLRTGDLGYRDGDGYFFVTDRKKEIIIKGGYNVSPKEVEEAILAHPSVKDAAVIGVRKNEREAIKAFVVAREPVEAEDLLRHLRGSLSAFKVPDEIEFRGELPRSLAGKVLKKELKETFMDLRLIERSGDAAGGAAGGGCKGQP